MANIIQINGKKLKDTSAARMSSLAPVELSATASAAHAVGDYFWLNGTLYEATAAIAIGNTITVGTNCEVAYLGAEVSELKTSIKDSEAFIPIDLDSISHTGSITWALNAVINEEQSGNGRYTDPITLRKGQTLQFTSTAGSSSFSALSVVRESDLWSTPVTGLIQAKNTESTITYTAPRDMQVRLCYSRYYNHSAKIYGTQKVSENDSFESTVGAIFNGGLDWVLTLVPVAANTTYMIVCTNKLAEANKVTYQQNNASNGTISGTKATYQLAANEVKTIEVTTKSTAAYLRFGSADSVADRVSNVNVLVCPKANYFAGIGLAGTVESLSGTVTQLSSDLGGEETARQNADNALDGRLDNLEENVYGDTDYTTESADVTTDLLNESADLRIMLFTDNHDYTDFKYKKYADMMSHGVIDYLVGLGDYKEYNATHDKIWYKEHLLNVLTLAGRDANCLYAIGNHDVGIKGVNGGPNSADYMMSPKECYDVFNRQYSKNPSIVYDPDNPTRGYGYYYVDNEAAKIRMIVLNSSDIFQSDGSFIRYKSELMFMSQQQLTWFAHTACKLDKDDPSEWAIVVFIHYAFPYGGTEYMLFKILAAVKAGTSISREITVYNRLTLDGDTWTTTVDAEHGDTLSVNEDYSSQGAVDVCGIIYGHQHSDETKQYEGINSLIVRCDNGELDNFYLAPVTNYNAGKYYFTDIHGQMWAYEIISDYPTCAYVGYNDYFASSNMQTMPIARYDSNKNRIGSNSGATRVSSAPAGATEITGFVSERGTSRIGQESAEILCIDKVNKTLTFIPYGTASKRTVSY